MSFTYLARSVDIVWKLVESYGFDPEPLFREVRINPKLIEDPNARIRHTAVEGLWKKAAELVDDPCFGLKGANYVHPSHLHALGYAWLASSSLRTALKRLARYIRIVSELATIRFEEKPKGFAVLIDYKDDPRRLPWRTDSAMSILMAMCRANYGEELNPVFVAFTHPSPPCASEYFAYFRCPIRFKAKTNQLLLPLAAIDKRLISDNPQLVQLNEQIMAQYLAELDKDDIIQRVKATIIERLPSGNLSDQDVAKDLYLNVRTLQRQLRDQGTTFKSLLNEIRAHLAYQYIRDSRLNLNEISFLLGFSETSSFSRAFKRWTGAAPSTFRQGE